MCVFVREHPFGLLPGLPNVYCLDGAFRLQWMAEWPDTTDLCARIIGEESGVLVVESVSGVIIRLDAHTGVLLDAQAPMAATG